MTISVHRETRAWVQRHRRIFFFSWQSRVAGLWLFPSALLIVAW